MKTTGSPTCLTLSDANIGLLLAFIGDPSLFWRKSITDICVIPASVKESFVKISITPGILRALSTSMFKIFA